MENGKLDLLVLCSICQRVIESQFSTRVAKGTRNKVLGNSLPGATLQYDLVYVCAVHTLKEEVIKGVK